MLGQIKQTSKTILFEQFTADSENLIQYLKDPGSLEQRDQLIQNNLSVSSFREFLEKFTPTFYQNCTENKIWYTFEKEHPSAREIKITDHVFWTTLVDVYERKSVSGEHNFEFDYAEILEKLTPQYEMKRAKSLRKELEYNFYKAQEDNLLPADKKMYTEKAIQCRKDVARLYKENPLNLLPLALNTIETKIEAIKRLGNETNKINGGSNTLQLAQPEFNDEGDVQWIPYVPEIRAEVVGAEPKKLLLSDRLRNDINNVIPNNNQTVTDIILTTFTADAGESQELSVLEKKQENYSKLHAMNLQSFIDAVAKYAQKLLGVKIFFDQAVKKGDKFNAKLTVANCTVDEILENKDEFEKYLKQIQTTPEKKYWFAILPSVLPKGYNNKETLSEEATLDMDLDMDIDIDSENDQVKSDETTLTNAKSLLMLLATKNIDIMTFFNFKTEQSTSLSELTTDKIKEYEEQVSTFGSQQEREKMVFAYPNITILPKRNATISIVAEEINFNGIYVDAAYVAAGLVAGYQNPDNLEVLGYKNVLRSNPGVRFDLESDENNFKYTTTLGRETSLNYHPDVMNLIRKETFGFVLGSDQITYQGEKIKNVYAIQARTLAKNDGHYKKIFNVLRTNFIKTLIKDEVWDIQNVKTNLEERCTQWKKDSEKVNAILKDDENIQFNDNRIEIISGFEPEYVELEVTQA